ncbi:hypothetical protein OR16_18481 [Cupriavidus basilensis OR16]|uniref:Fimbrial-type adhesion domain-containing protein n=2 Tax=Cupriavidus basilensis TaxID=68895 RepID=H1S6Z6_9BURK|nr:hypothetical protein OR16_18481 [Cupriavidus basilensis OR16]
MPASAAAAVTAISAFGQQIALPSTTPVGTVVGRHFISPGQACGAPTCKLGSVALWYNGGSVPSLGPIITTNVSGISTRLLINGQAVSGGNLPSVTEVSAIEVQLLRDARTFIEGSLKSNAYPGYFNLCARSVPAGNSCKSSNDYGGFASIDLSGKITPIKGTCSTPDQTITLPPALAPGFRGVGTAIGTTAFQLRLNNCPAGFYRVGYSFTPVSGTVANFPGTLAPLSGSTATGVAIRLADQQNVPIAFDRSMAVTDYVQSTGGSFSIPLSASYVQTKPVVTAGTIRGAVSVLIDYQ